ncbi:MAG: aminoacyl-tRNA deacylase [Streptococcaceae bacterium]|jgi:Cys-tRNA(Pro)/Cys-tRNA(Cys) deacylase|nr:aminoacyl-tRNA deacylase [Streptococcaceae bacterium]
MSKKTAKKTLVEQILEKAGVAHEALILNALNTSEELPEGISRHTIYKTLALVGDKTGPLVAMVPLTAHVSEKKLAAISGNKKVQMIPAKDLQKTTGYVHGANNPVGIRQKHAFPIFIALSALTETFFVCSAGEVGRSIRVNPQSLADFVGAEFRDIIDA